MGVAPEILVQRQRCTGGITRSGEGSGIKQEYRDRKSRLRKALIRSFALHNRTIESHLAVQTRPQEARCPPNRLASTSPTDPTYLRIRWPSAAPPPSPSAWPTSLATPSLSTLAATPTSSAPPPHPTGPGVYGVYGVLYTLPPADEATLDVCEGVPYAYQKHDLHVMVVSTAAATGPPKGAGVTALVYVDAERTAPSSPQAEYVGRMNRGVDEAAKLFGLPATYVDRVVRSYIPAPESSIVGATGIVDPFLFLERA
ncbi:hypothetical protein LX36DRAFT_666512 [Colletotrichum falcatum]|nr:hypothetical protein LX36DRAFT_666512 [Colletotrichum falcatum]